MNDPLFPTLSASDAEGLRTVRGIVIATIAGTAFWVSVVVGAAIGAVIS